MLSLVVPTRNEATRIGDCLRSVPIAREALVLDCGSADDTVAVARDAGAVVVETDWPGYAAQRNRGLRLATGEWVLFLDADERMTPAGVDELDRFLARPEDGCGASFPRRNHFLGRPLGRLRVADRQVRLVRKGHGRWSGVVHERLWVEGAVRRLRVPLQHHSHDTVGRRVETLRAYARLWAEEQSASGRRGRVWDPLVRPPLHLASALLWKMAWADGWPGLAHAGLEAWYVHEKWRLLRAACTSR